MLLKLINNSFELKQRKLTTMKEIWKPSLSIDFDDFVFSAYSLIFALVEKIYETLETMFHWLSKHLKSRQKDYAVRHIFNSPLSIWISLRNAVSLVWYITSNMSLRMAQITKKNNWKQFSSEKKWMSTGWWMPIWEESWKLAKKKSLLWPNMTTVQWQI